MNYKGFVLGAVLSCTAVGLAVTLPLTGHFNHHATTGVKVILQEETYRVVDENGVPAIYLGSTLLDPGAYLPLVAYLESHQDVPDMKMYLSGDGGDVRSLVDLVNVISASKTRMHMIVYGDVYSAHAVLAMNGYDLTVLHPETLFLFHAPAVMVNNTFIKTPDVCAMIPDSATDRGISARTKCFEFFTKTGKAFETSLMLKVYPYLSADEKVRYAAGYDILVSAQDLYDRGLRHK